MSLSFLNVKKSVYQNNKIAVIGNSLFKIEGDEDKTYIEGLYKEALKKYARMHCDDPSKRFRKTWTGEMGQKCFEHVLSSIYNKEVIRSKQIIGQYEVDTDVRFVENGEQKNIAISTREISKRDSINYFLENPNEFLALIPVGQQRQYIDSKLWAAVFVFLKYDRDTVDFKIDNVNLQIPVSTSWICAGQLRRDILVHKLITNSLLDASFKIKKQGEIIKIMDKNGIFKFNLPMYTDNFVIPLSSLNSLPK